MKSIAALFLSLLMISAPLYPISSERESPLSSNEMLLDHFYETQNRLSGLCDGDPDVLKRNKVFLVELQRAYVAGTGMIDKDIHRILDAIIFAATKHQKQKRKDYKGTPYIIHPIGV